MASRCLEHLAVERRHSLPSIRPQERGADDLHACPAELPEDEIHQRPIGVDFIGAEPVENDDVRPEGKEMIEVHQAGIAELARCEGEADEIEMRNLPLNPSLRRLPGERISNAPEFVVTNALSWTPPIGVNGLSGLVYLNARTTSDYNTGSSLGDVKIQDGYTVVNARLGVRGPEGSWAIEGWAKNLFDTDYTQVIFDSAFQGTYSAYLAEPRTYGITLRSRF